jgi:hypothetical protein
MRPALRVGVALGLLIATAGCSAVVHPPPARTPHVGVLAVGMPATLAGLADEPIVVTPDSTEAERAHAAHRTHLDAVALFSLAIHNEVAATLEVARFEPGPRYESERFRQSVLSQLGGTPEALRLGDQLVWVTASGRTDAMVWFRDRVMFLLQTTNLLPRPYSTVRALLAVQAS